MEPPNYIIMHMCVCTCLNKVACTCVRACMCVYVIARVGMPLYVFVYISHFCVETWRDDEHFFAFNPTSFGLVGVAV